MKIQVESLDGCHHSRVIVLHYSLFIERHEKDKNNNTL